MRGVLMAAVLILAVMVAINDGRLLRKAGLTGGCHAVAAPKGQDSDGDGDWLACDPGKLQGAPDLTRHSCKSVSFVGKTEYWRCPAGIGDAAGT
jgi:hypothetical protein